MKEKTPFIQEKTVKPLYNLKITQGKNIQNNFPCHFHDSYCIGIITKGKGILNCNKKSYILKKNTLYFINPESPHYLYVIDNINYCVISLKKELLTCLLKNFSSTRKTGYHFFETINKEAKLINIMKDIIFYCSEKNNPVIIKLLLKKLFLNLLSKKFMQAYKKSSPHYQFLKIKKSLNFINQNIYKNLSLADLAIKTNLNPFYYNKIFHKYIGITPHQYQIQQKIKISKQILLNSSITDTALDLGFFDQSHFQRFFKRHIGITPGLYIKINKEK